MKNKTGEADSLTLGSKNVYCKYCDEQNGRKYTIGDKY